MVYFLLLSTSLTCFVTFFSEFAESTILTIAHRLRTVIDYDRVSLIDTFKTFTRLNYKQVMLLERGRIIEFDRYALLSDDGDDEKNDLVYLPRPATLLKDSTSKFYSLCKATGKAEFAILKRMAGV